MKHFALLCVEVGKDRQQLHGVGGDHDLEQPSLNQPGPPAADANMEICKHASMEMANCLSAVLRAPCSVTVGIQCKNPMQGSISSQHLEKAGPNQSRLCKSIGSIRRSFASISSSRASCFQKLFDTGNRRCISGLSQALMKTDVTERLCC